MMRTKSANAPRRLYARKGTMVLCFDGLYYGPKAKATSKFDKDVEVTTETLSSVGGKARIKVTQKVKGHADVVEVWTEKTLTFVPRTAKAA